MDELFSLERKKNGLKNPWTMELRILDNGVKNLGLI